MSYLLYFSLAAVLAALITPAVRRRAIAWNILDNPAPFPKKIHTKPVPFLGGIAVFSAFLIAFCIFLFSGPVDFNIIPKKFFAAIIGGALVLMIGGFLDDKYELPPKFLWIFPALASLIVVLSGIGVGITELSNPFGAPIRIDYHFALYTVHFALPALLAWLWMMGMIFTTKFLDGIDGLCAGISMIGGLTLFALSLTERVNQPMTASLAVIFSGALFGYLFYAFHPASIFLGESGSTFTGFMLGVLAIILGGKIATALLVMGIPILDIAWAIVRRLWYGRSPFKGDRQHLHHRLIDIGFSQRQAVLILYGISAVFGFTAVFLQSIGKLIALVILFCVMLGLAISVVIVYKRKQGILEMTK